MDSICKCFFKKKVNLQKEFQGQRPFSKHGHNRIEIYDEGRNLKVKINKKSNNEISGGNSMDDSAI